jgi:hypothetical protein
MGTPLHLMVTSQLRTHFTAELKDVTAIYLDGAATSKDIRLFVDSKVREIVKMKSWASRADEIIARVVFRSNGMFVPCFLNG